MAEKWNLTPYQKGFLDGIDPVNTILGNNPYHDYFENWEHGKYAQGFEHGSKLNQDELLASSEGAAAQLNSEQ